MTAFYEEGFEGSTTFNLGFPTQDKFSQSFFSFLKQKGIDFAVGIPCGVQRDVIHLFYTDPSITNVHCTHEGEAVGIAVGAYLAGKHPVVYMQNSGLFSASNDIASLAVLYQIPLLLTVTWRGVLGEDAPQHKVTGKATINLLQSLEVGCIEIKKDKVAQTVEFAFQTMYTTRRPFAILFQRGWNK